MIALKRKKRVGKEGRKMAGNAPMLGRAKLAGHAQRHKRIVKSTLVAVALVVVMLLALKALSMLYPSLSGNLANAVNGWGLFGVFVIIFLGSSLLPFPTDAVFVALISASGAPLPIVAVAIVASFVSGLVNYALASALSRAWVEQRMGKEAVQESKEFLDQWGQWAIIIFGVIPNPLIDTMTFVAGLGNMDLKKFALYSAIARVLHFGLLAYLALATKLL